MSRPTSAPFRRLAICLLLAAAPVTLLATARPAPSTESTETGGPDLAASEKPRLLIVSVDGLRPDLMLRARTPNIHALFEGGSFSFWARTTPHAITLPSHVSMLTGCIPRRHEIEWNIDLPLKEPVYPKVPTLFDLAKREGYSTALAAGKSKFDVFNRPGSIDHFSVPKTAKVEDADVRDAAVEMIRVHRPEVMVVHFPSVDNVGHRSGWATPAQVAAIEAADRCVGDVLHALDDAGVRRRTTVLLTCDHGGAGLTHLPDDPRARHIVWVMNGPGVRSHFDLSSLAALTINTEDTFATACGILRITPPVPIDGKPILEALRDPGELMTRTTSRYP